MIFSDGTTSYTYENPKEDISLSLERASVTSAGGRKKSQTAGKRFKIFSTFRTNDAGYNNLMDLLTNSSLNYYYTPSEYTEYTSAIEVDILNIEKVWDSAENVKWITLEMEGVQYES